MQKERVAQMLRPILWDSVISVEEACLLLEGAKLQIRGVSVEDIYRKLLMSYSWYTLLEILGLPYIQEKMLQQSVIETLFPDSLRKRYRYVRSILLS